MLFPQVLGAFVHGFFATRTPNSQNHSYVHYSLSKFTGEWFTNHSNHIHRFTPITRIVATKINNFYSDNSHASLNHAAILVAAQSPRQRGGAGRDAEEAIPDYQGPRSYYVNNSQGNDLCNCICDLAAKMIL